MRPIELVALGAISGVAAGSMCALLVVLSHIRTLNRRLAKLEMLRWMSQTPQGVEQSAWQATSNQNMVIGVATQRAAQTAAQNSLAQAQFASTVAAQVQAHAQALATVTAAKAVSGPNPSLKKPTP